MDNYIDLNYKLLASGIYVPNYTVDKLINNLSVNDYIEHLIKDTNLATSTINKYKYDIKTFIKYLNNKSLSKYDVKLYLKACLNKKRPSSVNTIISALNGYFRYINRLDCVSSFIKFQEAQYIDDNRYLSELEFNKLLEVGNYRDKCILYTFRNTGIRVSELKYFTYEAVLKGRITVNNKAKIREVFIDRETRSLLLEYCKANGINNGVIFRGRNNKELHRNTIWKNLKDLAKKAKILPSKVFPHNLRHLFAVETYKLDKDIEALRLDMGHSLISTTQRYLKKTISEHYKRINKNSLLSEY